MLYSTLFRFSGLTWSHNIGLECIELVLGVCQSLILVIFSLCEFVKCQYLSGGVRSIVRVLSRVYSSYIFTRNASSDATSVSG